MAGIAKWLRLPEAKDHKDVPIVGRFIIIIVCTNIMQIMYSIAASFNLAKIFFNLHSP